MELNGLVDEEGDDDDIGEDTFVLAAEYKDFRDYIMDEILAIQKVQELREFIDNIDGIRFEDGTLNDKAPIFIHLLNI